MIQYVYTDSSYRDTSIYPYGNSYTTYLTTPLKNITQVDVVQAKIPNSFYNYKSGDFLLSNVAYTIPAGFYSSYGLTKILSSLTGLYVDYLTDEGKFIFSSIGQFGISLTGDFVNILGNVYGTSYLSTGTPYQNLYPSLYILKSQGEVFLNQTSCVVLDIQELRNSTFIDTRPLSGYTYTNTISRSLAVIPLDVASAQIKTFKEKTDYEISAFFPQPIESLQRITLQWLDTNGNLLNFNGVDQNSVLLRVHCNPPREPEPEEKDTELDLLEKRMTRAIQDAIPPPKPEKKPTLLYAVIAILVATVLFLRFGPKPTSTIPVHYLRPIPQRV